MRLPNAAESLKNLVPMATDYEVQTVQPNSGFLVPNDLGQAMRVINCSIRRTHKSLSTKTFCVCLYVAVSDIFREQRARKGRTVAEFAVL